MFLLYGLEGSRFVFLKNLYYMKSLQSFMGAYKVTKILQINNKGNLWTHDTRSHTHSV